MNRPDFICHNPVGGPAFINSVDRPPQTTPVNTQALQEVYGHLAVTACQFDLAQLRYLQYPCVLETGLVSGNAPGQNCVVTNFAGITVTD